jgi:hypothetical protein
MIFWISIILLIFFIILGYFFFYKKTEAFQDSSTVSGTVPIPTVSSSINLTGDNTPPININTTVSPDLIQKVVNDLSANGIDVTNVGANGVPAGTYNKFTPDTICAQFTAQLNKYNSELQRHRIEGNWNHVKATKSYINIVKQRQLASSCPTN